MIVHNEEKNIEAALQTLLPWCDEVIVVDQESTDKTAEIARALGATVIPTTKANIPEPSLELGMSHCKGEYIFRLDGDERVTPKLAQLLTQVSSDKKFKAVYVPRANYFAGVWVREQGWWPDYQLRFFTRDAVQVSPYVHEGLLLADGVEPALVPTEFEYALRHFTYLDIHDWISRTDRYTDLELDKLPKINSDTFADTSLQIVMNELKGILLAGTNSGNRNTTLAIGMLRLAYRFIECAKLWQSIFGGTLEEILALYRYLDEDIGVQWSQTKGN